VVLVNQLLIKLKILLRFDYLYYLILFISFFYALIIINSKIEYNLTNTTIKGYIKNTSPYIIDDTIIKTEEILNINDYVILEGKYILPNENTNFNLFNYRKYLLSNKIKYLFIAEKVITKQSNFSVKKTITSYIENYDSPYLNAIILNKTKDINLETYQINGVSHLFSISGLHISIISHYLITIISKISKRSIITYTVVFLILLFYAYLINFRVSIIRSILLFILIFINKTFNLKIKTINILIFILSILLVYNPYFLYNMGFYFTFIISYFLLLANIKNNNILKTSYIAMLSSIPLLIYNNSTFNITSYLANIIFIPIVTALLPLGFITLILPNSVILDTMFTLVENLSLFLSNYKIEIIISKPNIIYIVLYYLVIYKTLKNKRYLILFLILLSINYNMKYFNNNFEVHMIDVGQGDSIFIKYPNNKLNILIDTGPKDSNYNVIPYLKSIGINKIDYMILTHGDTDHCNEAINILNSIKVNKVFLNNNSFTELETTIINHLEKKKIDYFLVNEIKLNNITLKTYPNNDENKNSIITNIKYLDYKLLFMGDASINEEIYYKEKVTLLKVGHHGSKTSTSQSFINNIKPDVSLVSVGRFNIFRHPNEEVINRLDKYYLTSQNGSIKVVFSNKIDVYTRFK
jgi:competence protein ComEC